METIICKSSSSIVIAKLQEYLQKNGNIGGIYMVDSDEEHTVLLLSDKPISTEVAEAWWSGYQTALK